MKSKSVVNQWIMFAAAALVAISTPILAFGQSTETLLAYLKSPNFETRREAAQKLGDRRLHDQSVVEALSVAASRDDDPDVRAEAIHSLGKIKSFSGLNEVLGGLKDEDQSVRLIAIKSLVMFYTEHDIDFITNRRTGWNVLNPFLDTSDHEVIEPYVVVDPSIITALGESARNDKVENNRIAAIRALGVLRGGAALEQLGDALNADQDVRVDVIRTFIKIGDPAAGRYLTPFFTDSDQKVRTQAMYAAGMLKYEGAVGPLLSVYGLGPAKRGPISTITGTIRGRFEYLPPRDEAALWSLSLIGDPRAELIFNENMQSDNSDRRQYAYEGLARIGESKYLDRISRLILTEHNKDVKLAMQWAMYKMGQRDQLQDIVRRLDSGQHDQARQYLIEANSPSDLYPYVDSSSEKVRREVISILGKIGDRDTVAILKPVAESSGRKTADDATVAIKSIEWKLAGGPRATDRVLGSGEVRPRRATDH